MYVKVKISFIRKQEIGKRWKVFNYLIYEVKSQTDFIEFCKPTVLRSSAKCSVIITSAHLKHCAPPNLNDRIVMNRLAYSC